jgi:hypothetical protein
MNEEELELAEAPVPRPNRLDFPVALVALVVVVVASIVMERAAVTLGRHFSVASILVGAVVLAAVTSLPNAVAAVYLARRGRGAAMLSTALNSNALNIAFGLLVPATLVGLGVTTRSEVFVTFWYFGLSAVVLVLAYHEHGLRRLSGIVILVAYSLFVVTLVVVAHGQPSALASWGPAVLIGSWVAIVALAPRQADESGNREVGPAVASGKVTGNGTLQDARHRKAAGSLESWSPGRIAWVGFVLVATVAAIDALAGSRLILVGLLIIGPCCGVLTQRGRYAAGLSVFALACALAVAVPDGIWLTWTQFAFTAGLVVVGAVATAATATVERAAKRLAQ